MPSSSGKKARAPKGWAQIPEWWMEITPHYTLDVEEDEAKRRQDKQEADMYAHLAAEADKLHPDAANYRLGDNGELLDKDGNEINVEDATDGSGKSKYTRSPKSGEWLLDGKPLFGRQFKPGEVPEGYTPGGSYDYSSNGKNGSSDLAWVANSKSGLKAASAPTSDYGHQDTNWKKPDWMKVKLKSTGAGGNIRQGDYSQTEGKITMATQKAPSVPLKSTSSNANPVDE